MRLIFTDLDMVGVTGSNPVPPTTKQLEDRRFRGIRQTRPSSRVFRKCKVCANRCCRRSLHCHLQPRKVGIPHFEEFVEQRTYPHLDTPSRVLHVIGFGADEAPRDVARSVYAHAKVLGTLISTLQQSGTLSEQELNEILVETTL
ncbi:hypothetical protein ABE488_00955 [Luteimonas sp. TWI662]|uniref:hypothetical protein n=1 Tax=Luteimonas sp. TWI662 TaxID=3136789 RepID=UPI00320AA8DB